MHHGSALLLVLPEVKPVSSSLRFPVHSLLPRQVSLPVCSHAVQNLFLRLLRSDPLFSHLQVHKDTVRSSSAHPEEVSPLSLHILPLLTYCKEAVHSCPPALLHILYHSLSLPLLSIFVLSFPLYFSPSFLSFLYPLLISPLLPPLFLTR